MHFPDHRTNHRSRPTQPQLSWSKYRASDRDHNLVLDRTSNTWVHVTAARRPQVQRLLPWSWIHTHWLHHSVNKSRCSVRIHFDLPLRCVTTSNFLATIYPVLQRLYKAHITYKAFKCSRNHDRVSSWPLRTQTEMKDNLWIMWWCKAK